MYIRNNRGDKNSSLYYGVTLKTVPILPLVAGVVTVLLFLSKVLVVLFDSLGTIKHGTNTAGVNMLHPHCSHPCLKRKIYAL